ncbi:MAG: indolepyruvate ferredoxin oxidoreductase [Bacteroidales bacterium]|jgi:indolepyruvate ferredoxin oxidoreductase alpha subunit|nr:indolepyruvate ferredoxin oxidoreductase [Bacteroidales bacterium]
MKENLLLGAEAIALAAIDAGISGVYAYPGTPSTEITEFIQKSNIARQRKIHSTWATNEKTAYEAALGMSFAGKRSIVCMKHVGLNVAADPFMSSSLTGVRGGLLLVVADDPSMHSSQNEQDSRALAKFAMLPLIEPSTQQEAYNAVHYAFAMSEELALPVVIRISTRISHSRAAIVPQALRAENALSPDTDTGKWILMPAYARRHYAHLLALQPELVKRSETSPFLAEHKTTSKQGVIAFGLAYNYVMEVLRAHKLNVSVLKISQYPLPETQVQEFCNAHEHIIVAEEGYPVYEELLRGFFNNPKIHGRLDGTLPRTGELNPDIIAQALGIPAAQTLAVPSLVVGRPPELCKGCGHRDVFEALNAVMQNYENKQVFSDIGCYSLGALPPFNAINTCVDMGAGVTMAKGAADAGMFPAVGIVGDSTFTHSGITALLDAVNDNSPVTIIISDNSTTAMTGGQDSAGTGKLEQICIGLGVAPEHIRTIIPLKPNLEKNITILKEEIEYQGVSVVIAQRECVQVAMRKRKK